MDTSGLSPLGQHLHYPSWNAVLACQWFALPGDAEDDDDDSGDWKTMAVEIGRRWLVTCATGTPSGLSPLGNVLPFLSVVRTSGKYEWSESAGAALTLPFVECCA